MLGNVFVTYKIQYMKTVENVRGRKRSSFMWSDTGQKEGIGQEVHKVYNREQKVLTEWIK